MRALSMDSQPYIHTVSLALSYFVLAMLLLLCGGPAANATQSDYAFLSARALLHNQQVIAQEKEMK